MLNYSEDVYYNAAYCDGVYYDRDPYYDLVYCGGEYFDHDNSLRERRFEEADDLDDCDESNCDQGNRDREDCDQETYNLEEHCYQENCDQDYDCLTDLIDEDHIVSESCTSSKECEPPHEGRTHVYAVVHEIQGLYSPSEHKVQGMYRSLEKAHAAARRLFMNECPGSGLRKVKSFSAMGSGAEWRKDADGRIEFRTFSEGSDGWRNLIYVTERRLN